MLFDDPLFGLFAYGGEVARNRDVISVIPRDGVRQRFSALLGATRLHLELDRDGFAADQPLELAPGLDVLRFSIENRALPEHNCLLRVEGLPKGTYALSVNGENPAAWLVSSGMPLLIPIQVAATTTPVSITRSLSKR